MSEEIKALDTKLERILADPSCDDFILADAKDAGMAFGMASPGANSPKNDNIARTLAGVVESGRPLFLKIAYHGPAAMEQLVEYDRSIVVGILGGASGTTLDAFHQLWEAKK